MTTPRRLLSALAAAAAAVALAPAGAQAQAPTCADADLPATAANAARVTAAVGCLVDAERTARGLAPLASESRLVTAATDFAQSMLTLDFFDHEGPDGSTPGSRVSAVGYLWSTVGENIAPGQETAREVMTAWMKSAGHCENVLGAGYTQLGVGMVTDGRDVLWVQNFGRPRGVAAPSSASAAAACPAAGLVTSSASGGSGEAGSTTGTGTGSGAGAGGSTPSTPGADDGDGEQAGTSGAKLTFRVTRVRGGKLRISGTIKNAGRQTVRIEVRRGVRRSVKFVKTSGRFAVRMAGSRGARVTVSAAGARARTTVR